jgi:hypothetical protein
MQLQRSVLMFAAATNFLVCADSAQAVSLRPGKATDDSVCDLSHDTIGFLGGSVLIPSSATPKDQVDGYFRLGATFVALKCADGQLLILQGLSSSSIASPALQQIASSACPVAAISRSEASVPVVGRALPGFELRCVISKRDELAKKLAELERADPMESLKARLAAAARDPGSTTRASGSSAEQQKDCGQVTLSSLLQGGGCKK